MRLVQHGGWASWGWGLGSGRSSPTAPASSTPDHAAARRTACTAGAIPPDSPSDVHRRHRLWTGVCLGCGLNHRLIELACLGRRPRSQADSRRAVDACRALWQCRIPSEDIGIRARAGLIGAGSERQRKPIPIGVKGPTRTIGLAWHLSSMWSGSLESSCLHSRWLR